MAETSGQDAQNAEDAALSMLGTPQLSDQEEFERLKWTTIPLRGKSYRVDTIRMQIILSQACAEFAEAETGAQFEAMAKACQKEFGLEEPLTFAEAEIVYSLVIRRHVALQKKTKAIVESLTATG